MTCDRLVVFSEDSSVPSPMKLNEIFLKVELNTIIQAKPYLYKYTQKLDTVIVFPLVNTQINVLIQIQFW